MKKYIVTVSKNNREAMLAITASHERSARNKAVRHARVLLKDKTINANDIVKLEYLGFYMSGIFIPASDIKIN